MKTYHTGQREQLLSYLAAHPTENFRAADLTAALAHDGCSRSTLYRCLSRLEGEGLVRRSLSDVRGEEVYQYVHAGDCSGHLHLKCMDCGRLIHLDGETGEALQKSILALHGFAINEGETVLFGRCAPCRKETH